MRWSNFVLTVRRRRRRAEQKKWGTFHTPAEGWPPSALPLFSCKGMSHALAEDSQPSALFIVLGSLSL